VLTESTRRSGDGSLFHARRAATSNERSPSDDVARGTATEPDVADLRPALAVAAADGVMRSATMNSHAQQVGGVISRGERVGTPFPIFILRTHYGRHCEPLSGQKPVARLHYFAHTISIFRVVLGQRHRFSLGLPAMKWSLFHETTTACNTLYIASNAKQNIDSDVL